MDTRQKHHDEPFKKPQLPSLQDLLNKPIRLGPTSPGSGGWNDRLPPPVNVTSPVHGIPYTGAPVFGPPRQHAMEMPMADNPRANMYPPTTTLPIRPIELLSPAATERHDHVSRNHDYFSSPPYHSLTMMRPSSTSGGKADAGDVFGRQLVGHREIPGEGLCYVLQDGSILEMTDEEGTLINPLWGKTKAGKARKRLAQACL